MNKLLRLLNHSRFDVHDAERALGAAGLQRTLARVAASEQRHSGEIRVCIEARLPVSYLWRGAAVRERALAMFGKLRVWDTEHNNGVLIYLLLAERAIEIVADRGLAQRADASHWQGIAAKMREAFQAGRFEDGLAQAIAAVDALLFQHFALALGEASPNELPDSPALR